jgi:hypothetical protein
MNDKHLRKLEQSRADGREILNRLRLSPKERLWVEREAEQLVSSITKTLSERLEAGVSFKAIPAVFAYALAVVNSRYKPENEKTIEA